MPCVHEVTEERPNSKTMLPFRALRNGLNQVYIECDAVLDNGQRIPFRLQTDDTKYNPVGHEVLSLMRLYWDLEASVDSISKEKQDLLAQVHTLTGQLEDAKKRLQGYEAQARQNWVCKCGRKNKGEQCASCNAERP